MPLVSQAFPHISHFQIRNRGTVCGSIAHADPSAELPLCLLALDGEVMLRSKRGTRIVPAKEFFLGTLLTAREPDELIEAVSYPLAKPGQHFAFDEFSMRHGDYAIVGLAVATRVDQGKMHDTRLSFLGIGTTPVRARETEGFLDGHAPDAAVLQVAARILATELVGALAPLADLTNSAATKRHLATVLLQRVVGAFSK